MIAGMIIDQRRPNASATQPQRKLETNVAALENISGTATSAAESARSFCRCVANSAKIE